MTVLLGLIAPLQVFNNVIGKIGQSVAVVAMGLMVLAILIQVFFRYVLNNALPWPDEAARFFMLWMTGLIAPVAYRRGGFVAIDMLIRALPRSVGATLSLVLLVISLAVLVTGIQLGHSHVMSGCLFKSASLWMPFTLEFAIPVPGTDMSLTLCTKADFAMSITWGWVKMPLALMYASIFTGCVLMTIVNIELILRSLVEMMGGSADLPEIPGKVAGAD